MLPPNKSCPRLRGKWHGEAMTKGERLKAAKCREMFPLSFAYAQQLPHKWWRLLVQYKHGVQCRTPSRSDRFNGVTGVARGPKGRNRNLPWPPGKKDYKIVCSAFCLFYSFRLLVSLASTSLDREALGCILSAFPCNSASRADMQANYCLHLIFMIYLKAKSPQGVRHAKAAYC